MLEISLVFAMSSLCLIGFSTVCRDGIAQAVDGEGATPLDDEAWTLVDSPLSDITLSVLKLASICLTDSPTVLRSSDM
jgi:hypothetical protein